MTGTACVAGYVGTATATSCAATGQPYVVSGCTETTTMPSGVASTSVVVVRVDGITGFTTFRLAIQLRPEALTVYTLFDLNIPAAYQVATPFGTTVGQVQDVMFGAMPESEFDSWLTMAHIDAWYCQCGPARSDLEYRFRCYPLESHNWPR